MTWLQCKVLAAWCKYFPSLAFNSGSNQNFGQWKKLEVFRNLGHI